MGTVPIDARTLVIPTKQKNVLRILDFIGESQTNRLQGLFSSGDPQKINKRLPLFFFRRLGTCRRNPRGRDSYYPADIQPYRADAENPRTDRADRRRC